MLCEGGRGLEKRVPFVRLHKRLKIMDGPLHDLLRYQSYCRVPEAIFSVTAQVLK